MMVSLANGMVLPHGRGRYPVIDSRVLFSLRAHVLFLADVFQPQRNEPLHVCLAERPYAFRNHNVGSYFSDLHLVRPICHIPHAPSCSSNPSCAISRASIATLLCTALSDGPVHFTGMPRVNFHILAGVPVLSLSTINPSLRVPWPCTQL